MTENENTPPLLAGVFDPAPEGTEVVTADQFATKWNQCTPEARQVFVDMLRQAVEIAYPLDPGRTPEGIQDRLNAAWWLGAEFAWAKSAQGFNAEMEAGETFHDLFGDEVTSPFIENRHPGTGQ